jgi:hypothetical protein
MAAWLGRNFSSTSFSSLERLGPAVISLNHGMGVRRGLPWDTIQTLDHMNSHDADHLDVVVVFCFLI